MCLIGFLERHFELSGMKCNDLCTLQVASVRGMGSNAHASGATDRDVALAIATPNPLAASKNGVAGSLAEPPNEATSNDDV